MILAVTGGEVFTPAPAGRGDVLALNGAIARVGGVDSQTFEALNVPSRILDARGCLVLPGLIDPHVHLVGGSGDKGYNTASPDPRRDRDRRSHDRRLSRRRHDHEGDGCPGRQKLGRKGTIAPGADADLLVLRRETLEVVHVVAQGRVLMQDGVLTQQDRFLHTSARRIRLDGQEA